MVFIRSIAAVILLTGLLIAQPGFAQDEEMQLIEEVTNLQQRLLNDDEAQRDKAQQALIKLGPNALDHFEQVDKPTDDYKKRMEVIRIALEKEAVLLVTKSTHVNLSGSMTIDEAIQAIAKQTNNDVKLAGSVGNVTAQKEIDLKLVKAPFWDAMLKVMEAGDLEVDPYAGDRGQLRITESPKNHMPGLEKVELPADVTGIFEIVAARTSASRNFQNPHMSYMNIHLRVRWEPRVTPISIDMAAKSLKVIDEYDNPVKVNNQEAVFHGTVQPEIPELEFQIPIGLVDRQIAELKSLDATFEAVLPGRVEIFKLMQIGQLKKGAKLTKAGATLTFGGIHKNDDLFGVVLKLGFEEGHNALESHQSWVYDNVMYLENDKGERVDPIAFENLGQNGKEIGCQYYFEKNPGELNLVYKTPALIVKTPVKFTLKDIPLP